MNRTITMHHDGNAKAEGMLGDYSIVMNYKSENIVVISILHRVGCSKNHAVPVSRMIVSMEDVERRLNKFFKRKGIELTVNYSFPSIVEEVSA